MQGPEPLFTGGHGRKVQVVIPFADQRTITHRCGMKKGALGGESGDILCNTKPAEWVAQRLADELRASGFTVVESDAPVADGTLRIEGALLTLFVEAIIWHYNIIETDIQVELVATSGDGLRAERVFFVKKAIHGANVRFAKFYQESLNLAARHMASRMVEAILELLEAYPTVGNWQTVPGTAQRGDLVSIPYSPVETLH
jgi:hypothetical protein